jgi:DNA-directed RNA polymerase specialized sigma24 family protein
MTMTSSRPDKPPPAVPPEYSDHDLWDAPQRRDPEALGGLFSRYCGVVHAYAVRHTGSYSTADDAVRATFLSAWRQFTRSDPGPLRPETAKAWLLTIARNELNNITRAKRRFTRLVSRQPAPLNHPNHAETVGSTRRSTFRRSGPR